MLIKIFSLLLCFLALNNHCKAERFQLGEIVKIWKVMKSQPLYAVENITKELNYHVKGWSNPVEERSNGVYYATWTYNVGTRIMGTFRFIIQKVDDKTTVKISYLCPYESIYEEYVSYLTLNGAELVDSTNENDGGISTVLKYDSGYFVISKWAKSLGLNYGGVQTGYAKLLMYEQIN